MARIVYDQVADTEWHGPFPNKKGEFCGNVLRDNGEAIILHEDGKTVKEHLWSFSYLLLDDKNVRFRIGVPGDSGAGSSQELVDKGEYVGLYLLEDQPSIEGEQNVDTDMFLEEVVSGRRLSEKPFRKPHRDEGL